MSRRENQGLPERMQFLLKQLDSDSSCIPPTLIYNEGWMLRLSLDAAQRGKIPSVMPCGARWYSEGQLPTPFGRDLGPKHEANTRADAVFGDFAMVEERRCAIELQPDAKRFGVIEAKLYSPLSSRTKNGPGFDQAARTIACMANVLARADRHPSSMEEITFRLIAPRQQIESGIFDGPMAPDSIRARVKARILQFASSARQELQRWSERWSERWFEPVLRKLEDDRSLGCVSWETILDEAAGHDPQAADELLCFYERCKEFGQPFARQDRAFGHPVRGTAYVLGKGRVAGTLVRVCCVGPQRSRVYRLDHEGDTFLVSNADLETVPADRQPPLPTSPRSGHCYPYVAENGDEYQVQVVTVGDCRCRVRRVGKHDPSFLVPSFRLNTG